MVVIDHNETLAEESNLRLFHMNYSPDGHGGELWYQVVEDVRCKYKFSDVQTAIRRVQMNVSTSSKSTGMRCLGGIRKHSRIWKACTPSVKQSSNPAWQLYIVEINEESRFYAGNS